MRTFAFLAALAFCLTVQPAHADDVSDREYAQGLASKIAEANDALSPDVSYAVLNRTWHSLYFVFLHEIAHMLVHEYDLPVLGWEEDAADTLAVALLVGGDSADSDRALAAAIQQLAVTQQDASTLGPEAFYGAHSMNLQRAYHATCLLVGRDAERYGFLADKMSMPQDRRDACVHSSKRALDSWKAVLEPHRVAADVPRTGGKITVTYHPPEAGLTEAMAVMMRDLQFLEKAVPLIVENFDLPRDVEFIAGQCGHYGAHFLWEPPRVVMCYEMAAAHFDLFAHAALADGPGRSKPSVADQTLDPQTGSSDFGTATPSPKPGSWSIRLDSGGTWSGTDTDGNDLKMPTTVTVTGIGSTRTCPNGGTWPTCIAND